MQKVSAKNLKKGDVVKAPEVYAEPSFMFIERHTEIEKVVQAKVGGAPQHLYSFLFQFPSGQRTVMHIPLDYAFFKFQIDEKE